MHYYLKNALLSRKFDNDQFLNYTVASSKRETNETVSAIRRSNERTRLKVKFCLRETAARTSFTLRHSVAWKFHRAISDKISIDRTSITDHRDAKEKRRRKIAEGSICRNCLFRGKTRRNQVVFSLR